MQMYWKVFEWTGAQKRNTSIKRGLFIGSLFFLQSNHCANGCVWFMSSASGKYGKHHVLKFVSLHPCVSDSTFDSMKLRMNKTPPHIYMWFCISNGSQLAIIEFYLYLSKAYSVYKFALYRNVILLFIFMRCPTCVRKWAVLCLQQEVPLNYTNAWISLQSVHAK